MLVIFWPGPRDDHLEGLELVASRVHWQDLVFSVFGALAPKCFRWPSDQKLFAGLASCDVRAVDGAGRTRLSRGRRPDTA